MSLPSRKLAFEVWERVFIAALEGAASSYHGWDDKRYEYLVNRAEHIADLAEQRWMQRRKAFERGQRA